MHTDKNVKQDTGQEIIYRLDEIIFLLRLLAKEELDRLPAEVAGSKDDVVARN